MILLLLLLIIIIIIRRRTPRRPLSHTTQYMMMITIMTNNNDDDDDDDADDNSLDAVRVTFISQGLPSFWHSFVYVRIHFILYTFPSFSRIPLWRLVSSVSDAGAEDARSLGTKDASAKEASASRRFRTGKGMSTMTRGAKIIANSFTQWNKPYDNLADKQNKPDKQQHTVA